MCLVKRLFIALPLSAELKNAIRAYQQTLKSIPLRPAPEENLHITLVFIGATPEEEIPAIDKKIEKTLSSSRNPTTPYILIPKLFEPGPNPTFPHLLWLTLETSPALVDLQKRLSKELGKEEKRPFTTHVTIARIRPGATLWADTLRPYTIRGNLAFELTELYLMESILKPSGAEYLLVKKYHMHGS